MAGGGATLDDLVSHLIWKPNMVQADQSDTEMPIFFSPPFPTHLFPHPDPDASQPKSHNQFRKPANYARAVMSTSPLQIQDNLTGPCQ
jgi:hypothetical protein